MDHHWIYSADIIKVPVLQSPIALSLQSASFIIIVLLLCLAYHPNYDVFLQSVFFFLWQSTAPLAIKPYLKDFTTSEMHSLMVGGFATIAGSVLAVYIKFGVSAAHLLSASIMSAPASLVVAKMFVPEIGKPTTANHATVPDCAQ